MTKSDEILLKLQEAFAYKHGRKIDIYRQEGKGVLMVEHGKPLVPSNVLFQMADELLPF